MSKRLFLGVLLAVVAVLALVAVWVLRGDDGSTRAQGDTVEMGIDPEVTGNTASTLGTLEYCVRVDVESPAFDGVSDYDIDVYVRGDTQAPLGYDSYVTYDATKVHIAAPGTNTLIKLPGASGFGDALPDTDGTFVAGAAYLSGGPGIAGDGTLVRLGLDIGGSGIVTFDFDSYPPFTAYSSLSGGETTQHPITRMTAQLAINEDCPPGERPQPSPTPEEEDAGQFTPAPDKPVQEAGRYRWANVSIERPEGGDIYVTRDFDIYTHPGEEPYTSTPVILLSRSAEDGGGTLIIDANTGEVLSDNLRPDNRAAFAAMLATLRFEGGDVPDSLWPYGDEAPRGPRRELQMDLETTAVYFEPDPASGIVLTYGMGDSETGSTAFLQIRTARSVRAIDTTGKFFLDERGQPFGRLDPGDAEAFDRFISSIEFKAR